MAGSLVWVTTPLTRLALARGAVDRASHRRTDADWLAARWRDASTRVLLVQDGAATVTGDPPELVMVAPAEAPDPTGSGCWFLGLDDGVAVFAATGRAAGGAAAGLREVGALLSDRDAGLLTTAVALEAWHATHRHCPTCGARTTVIDGGAVSVCPVDGSLQHPRVDPAVIMAVVDDDDRLLLGHQSRWPAGRFSTLAGFVEPGESLEQAVAREVHEETGVVITSATYVGSQPWPFPRSLMLGFVARAATTTITEDAIEISEARWFTRAGLRRAVADRDVLLPPDVSVARRLIERWLGGAVNAASAFRDGVPRGQRWSGSG